MTTQTHHFRATVWQMALMGQRYLSGRKLRTVLTTLAIVFGVALIFAVNLVLPSVTEAFEQSLSTASSADIRILNVTGGSFAPGEVLATIADIPHVQAVSGVLERTITLPTLADNNPLGDIVQIKLIGIDPAVAENIRPFPMSAGRFLAAGDQNAVVFAAGVTELAPELQVGTTFSLITATGLKTFTVIGFIDEQGSLSAPPMYMTLADAQSALNQPGLINTVEVNIDANADEDAVTKDIENALGSSFQSDTASSVMDSVGALGIAFSVLDLLGFLALFLGAFLIFNTFRTVVVERHHDLAMLRAVGATRRQITTMIMIESLLQGIVGTLIGLILGYLLALAYISFIGQFYHTYFAGITIELRLIPSAVVLASVLGIITALLAGYLPARSAGRASPLEALRPATTARVNHAARWSLIVGVVLMLLAVALLLSGSSGAVGGALLFLIGMLFAAPGLIIPVARLFGPLLTLWFAREGDLARGNLARQPGRAALTGSTLMIGLAVLILITATISAFDVLVTNLTNAAFSSDIVLIPQAIAIYDTVIGADDSLATRLRALPETQTVASLRSAATESNGQRLQVFGIDPGAYPRGASLEFNEGQPDTAFSALASGRNAILTPLARSALGLEFDSDFVLETVDGPQTYHIVGVASDVLSFKVNAIYISQDNLAADFHKTEDVLLYLRLNPGEDTAAALTDVQQITQDYPQFTAYLTSDYGGDLIAMTNNVLPLFYALAFLILFPAALGLLNTLTINTIERTREIGVVRAVGGTRGQIRRIVIAEALLLGIFSAAMGVVAGVAISYGFIGAFGIIGWKVSYTFPLLGIIAAVVIGVMLTLFTAILPARNAAKLDIIRALQYE